MCEALDVYFSTLLNAMNVLLEWGVLSRGHSLIGTFDSVLVLQQCIGPLSLCGQNTVKAAIPVSGCCQKLCQLEIDHSMNWQHPAPILRVLPLIIGGC